MGIEDEKGLRGGRVLRFVVSGALLVAPAAMGCGGSDAARANATNEPMPTSNEPYEEETVNEAPPDEMDPVDEPVRVNEVRPTEDPE